eukprot:6401313-Amphidinium_carterae.1
MLRSSRKLLLLIYPALFSVSPIATMGKRAGQDGNASMVGSAKTAATEGTQKNKKDSMDNPKSPKPSMSLWLHYVSASFLEVLISLLLVSIPEDGVEWALYSEDSSGKRVPQESKCHRCHQVHLQGFKEQSWEELVGGKTDPKIKKKLDRAFQTYQDSERKWPCEDIIQNTFIGLEVNRSVVLMNERELRRECGTKKLSQKDLKALPAFVVPKEDGTGTEQIFAFHDASKPFRTGSLKILQGTTLQQWMLESTKALYPTQGQSQFPYFAAKCGATTGYQDMVEKEMRGNLHLQSLESFLASQQGKEDKDDELGAAESDIAAASYLESDVKLVGAAAADFQEHYTPAKKKTPGTTPSKALDHGRSSASLDEGTHSADAGEVMDSATCVGSDGVRARQGIELGKHVPSGPDALVFWKGKIDLTKILNGEKVLRGLTAFKRSVDTRLARDKDKPTIETMALNNFKTLATACANLGPKSFHTVPSPIVLETVEKVIDEGFELPYKLKFNILMREVKRIAAEKQYSVLVSVISPWSSEEFKPSHPKLAGVAESAQVRLATYKSVLFEQTLVPMLQEGEKSVEAILSLATECLKLNESVGFLNLDDHQALAMDEADAIFNGLTALATNTVEIKYEEPWV